MIDWHKLIDNLQWAGIGVTTAAGLAGVPAEHIAQLVKGQADEPPFSTGLKLIDLHLDACPGKHMEILED